MTLGRPEPISGGGGAISRVREKCVRMPTSAADIVLPPSPRAVRVPFCDPRRFDAASSGAAGVACVAVALPPGDAGRGVEEPPARSSTASETLRSVERRVVPSSVERRMSPFPTPVMLEEVRRRGMALISAIMRALTVGGNICHKQPEHRTHSLSYDDKQDSRASEEGAR